LSGAAVSAAVILTAAETPASYEARMGTFVDRALVAFASATH